MITTQRSNTHDSKQNLDDQVIRCIPNPMMHPLHSSPHALTPKPCPSMAWNHTTIQSGIRCKKIVISSPSSPLAPLQYHIKFPSTRLLPLKPLKNSIQNPSDTRSKILCVKYGMNHYAVTTRRPIFDSCTRIWLGSTSGLLRHQHSCRWPLSA